MVGLASHALISGGVLAALIAFAVAAVVIVVLMFTAAVTVAGAQEATVERFQTAAPAVKRWGGWLLVLVGAWFVILAVFAQQFATIFPV